MTSITAFTPSASCFAPTYTVAPNGNDIVENLTAIRGYAPQCMPFTPDATGVYPTMTAVNCLLGYEQLPGSQSVNGSTTYGTCCPSGMTVQSTSTQMCSSVTGYNSVTVVNATQTSLVHANFLVAPAMVMAWQSEDLVSLTTPIPTSTSMVQMVPTTLASSTTPFNFATATPAPGSEHVPSPDTVRATVIFAVCIVVGCLVAIGIVVAIAAFILARKRQHKAANAARGDVTQDSPPAYEGNHNGDALPRYIASSKSETGDIK